MDFDEEIDSLINLSGDLSITLPKCQECNLQLNTNNCCNRWCNNCLDKHNETDICTKCGMRQCPWCNIIKNMHCIKCTKCIMCRGSVSSIVNWCELCNNVICRNCYPIRCLNCNTQRCNRCIDPCKSFYIAN